MKWITRANVKVDRVACPWLIRTFIDRDAEFLFVPVGEVDGMARKTGAIPYDVAGVELGHHGEECSFDAIVKKYNVNDQAIARLALIVRGPTRRGAISHPSHLASRRSRKGSGGSPPQRATTITKRSAASGISTMRFIFIAVAIPASCGGIERALVLTRPGLTAMASREHVMQPHVDHLLLAACGRRDFSSTRQVDRGTKAGRARIAPKTKAGRARIAEAQRRRWKAFRSRNARLSGSG
jgi:hypothetical protein